MRSSLLVRGSVVFALALAGCPSTPVYDCPEDGAYIEAGVGRYCAYGVVIGGFDCPAELPNRFDFESTDPGIPDGFVCSDRPIGSRDDVPVDVCTRVPACGAPSVDAGPTDASPFDAGISPDAARPDAPGPASMCTAIGGTCTLPSGFPPTVSCPPGFATIGGSETGLGGYRQLGCGNTEAGPFACCVPTFDCGGTECPVLSVCIGRSGPAPEVFSCEPRPAACEGAADCSSPCSAETDCITAACGTFLDSASISGNTIRCPGA